MDVIPGPRAVGIGAWALQMCRIEHEPRAIEAQLVEQLNEMVEQPLDERLHAPSELPDRTQHGRLLVKSADKPSEHRVEAVLDLPKLELHFGGTQQQSAHHLGASVRRIPARAIVHPLVER